MGQSVALDKAGVHQGDPLGPLSFALAIQPFISSVKARFSSLKHASFLDDGSHVREATEVTQVLDVVVWEGLGSGIFLSLGKPPTLPKPPINVVAYGVGPSVHMAPACVS